MQIENGYPARISATGIQGLHGIRAVTTNFAITGPLTIEEARNILVNSTEILLNNINSNVSIRPYLIEYPFPPKRVSLTFWVCDKNFVRTNTPDVLDSFSLYDDTIIYEALQKRTIYEKEERRVTLLSETFEQAKGIVVDEKICK
jgi:hypothetical protein